MSKFIRPSRIIGAVSAIALTGLAAGWPQLAAAQVQPQAVAPPRAAGAGAPAPRPPNPATALHRDFPGGVIQIPDVTYATPRGFRPLKLDLYLPKPGGAPKPLVIWVHGGGWMAGDPKAGSQPGGPFPDFQPVLASLAARGYVVAGVSYRLSGEAKFPAAIWDVKAAVRWLRANAGVYGIDPARAVAWGGSAGGQLVSLLGTSCRVHDLEGPGGDPSVSSCVQAVVDWYGPIDFTQLDALALPGSEVHGRPESAESNYLGCNLPECPPDRTRAANAISYIDASDPPFLIMHGEADVSVAPKESQLLYDALRAKGVSAELVYVPGARHSFVGIPPAQGQPLLDRVFAFIDRQMGAAKR